MQIYLKAECMIFNDNNFINFVNFTNFDKFNNYSDKFGKIIDLKSYI